MTPQDVIWRVLERLQESKEIVAASSAELHPVNNQDLVEALHEVERLMQTQIHLMNRIRRRYL
jgi:hypothetical protein